MDMTSLRDLIDILKEIYRLHLEIVELAKQKRQLLIDGKIDELSKMINKETDWIRKTGRLEDKRIETINRILSENGSPDAEFAISDIIESVATLDEKAQLDHYNAKLKLVIEEVQHLNELNTKLIEQSLDYIANSINAMTSKDSDSFTYSKPMGNQGRLNNNRGFFDKKA